MSIYGSAERPEPLSVCDIDQLSVDAHLTMTKKYAHYGPYVPDEKKALILDQLRMLGRPARQHEIRAMIRYRFYMERGMQGQYQNKVLVPNKTMHRTLMSLCEEGKVGRLKPDSRHVFWYLTEQSQNGFQPEN